MAAAKTDMVVSTSWLIRYTRTAMIITKDTTANSALGVFLAFSIEILPSKHSLLIRSVKSHSGFVTSQRDAPISSRVKNARAESIRAARKSKDLNLCSAPWTTRSSARPP